MTERELGRSGLKVSSVGLGCMGMSGYYDPPHLNADFRMAEFTLTFGPGDTFFPMNVGLLSAY
jgi:aryl-alcohol dehydrogenase-like predicted oxidoreductase